MFLQPTQACVSPGHRPDTALSSAFHTGLGTRSPGDPLTEGPAARGTLIIACVCKLEPKSLIGSS